MRSRLSCAIRPGHVLTYDPTHDIIRRFFEESTKEMDEPNFKVVLHEIKRLELKADDENVPVDVPVMPIEQNLPTPSIITPAFQCFFCCTAYTDLGAIFTNIPRSAKPDVSVVVCATCVRGGSSMVCVT